jgi:guanylate kinase
LRSDVHKSIEAGQDILLEIDVQGQKQLKESGIPMLSLFVIPPSLDVLRARLRQRGTESEEEMNRRLAIVEEEMKWAQEYDHVVVNDDLEEMIQGVVALLGLKVKA